MESGDGKRERISHLNCEQKGIKGQHPLECERERETDPKNKMREKGDKGKIRADELFLRSRLAK